MNVRELRQLLSLIEDVIDEENVKVCLNESRDGVKSHVEATVRLTKDKNGSTILAVGY